MGYLEIPMHLRYPELVYSPRAHPGSGVMQPVVGIGETVKRGQVIWAPRDMRGTPVHAAAGGTVVGFESNSTGDDGDSPLLRIAVAEHGFSEPAISSFPGLGDLAALARAGGIVGHGGGGFPLHAKLIAARRTTVRRVVLNAVECEPPLACDRTMLLQHGRDVVGGLVALCGYLEVETCVIAVSNRTERVARLAMDIYPELSVQIVSAGDDYIAGDERILLRRLFGRDVAQLSVPSAEGYLVLNVGTALAVDHVLRTREPVLSRWTTLVDKTAGVARTVEIPLGARVDDALREIDVRPSSGKLVMVGGERMGRPAASAAGVTAATNCLMVVDPPPVRDVSVPCIRCGWCEDACSYNLPVYEMVREAQAVARGSILESKNGISVTAFERCTVCGQCEPRCPSRIPLVELFRGIKRRLVKDARATAKADEAASRSDRHLRRLDNRDRPVKVDLPSAAIADAVSRSKSRRRARRS